jgi:hypothetical protein
MAAMKSIKDLFTTTGEPTRGRGLPATHEAAKNGDAQAQHALATMYLRGIGVKKDAAAAADWLRKAADQGHTPSQFALARLLLYGVGVTKAPQEALGWLRKAAEGGHAEARQVLDGLKEGAVR